ncbi:MAG: GXGXG motif-containing protein [Proteobacteria bacterium]|nr:GXGXG motif-containing protein [Pseudomonadota bacterium]
MENKLSEKMRGEELVGRSQQMFFTPEEEENFLYPDSLEVDFDKTAEFDAAEMNASEINKKIRALMADGVGTITVNNPGAQHSIAAGILNRLKLNINGSLGYFGCGLIDGPVINISGRVGWSCGENMMSGVIEIAKNAGSTFGAAIRGGDLVCHGDVGGRTGICMKGGTIIVGGRTGAFTGFMMQRGRMIIMGDAGNNLGDTMYDGMLFVGGKISSLGVDATEAEMNDMDVRWLTSKLKLYNMDTSKIKNMTKIVSGKQLWNYDNLEPSEKKLVL